MPRFFFDINDGRTRARDDTGVDLDDAAAARRTAVQELTLIMRDRMPNGERQSYVVTVRDPRGRPIYVATAQVLGEVLD